MERGRPPDSSVIWVVAWQTSMSAPTESTKRIGIPDPEMPGRSRIQLCGK
jgi:hypothetical protein